MISFILVIIYIVGELIGNKYFELDGFDDFFLDYFWFFFFIVFIYLGIYIILY